ILEISAVQTDSPVGLKLSLSGKQPEKCELLWQYIPLIPGRRYRFRSQYRTSGIAAESGVRWSIFSSAARSPTLFRSSQLAGDDWKQEQGTFANGEGVLARL